MPISSLLLNIAGSEWIIIILVALVLIFGTKRLPQFSRNLGKAMGEYEKARQKFSQQMQAASGADIFKLPKITGPVATEREKLEFIASSLGIDSTGKTDDELKSLISQKMNA
jgi:sec-independent protein translocase protein TatA